jgi:hypothetical protein
MSAHELSAAWTSFRRRFGHDCRRTTSRATPGAAVGHVPACAGSRLSGSGRMAQSSWVVRSRRALLMTLTDDSAMAAAAMIGDSKSPVNG